MDLDYLAEARARIEQARGLYDRSMEPAAQSAAQLALACALVALIERLDRVVDSEDNTLYVTVAGITQEEVTHDGGK